MIETFRVDNEQFDEEQLKIVIIQYITKKK